MAEKNTALSTSCTIDFFCMPWKFNGHHWLETTRTSVHLHSRTYKLIHINPHRSLHGEPMANWIIEYDGTVGIGACVPGVLEGWILYLSLPITPSLCF